MHKQILPSALTCHIVLSFSENYNQYEAKGLNTMRRKKIRIISAVTAAFAIASGFALQGHSRANHYRQLIENSYTHACFELSTAVSELDSALQKAQYAATPVFLEVLCTDIYGKAVAAQMALGELPASYAILPQTSAFLARVGDYAGALSKSTAVNGQYQEEVYSTLAQLAETSAALSSSLLDLQSDLSGGSIRIPELLQLEQSLADSTGDGSAATGGTSFQAMESNFPEVPTLIYDGPFSEHLGDKEPLALAGTRSVSRDEARAVAADFLGLRPQVLTPSGEGNGPLPVWGFSATVDGGELYAEVTKQGGKVLSLFTNRTASDATLTTQEGLAVARSFLSQRGYHAMKESYYMEQGNILTVNFASVQDDVLCYPDLIKVSVALDSGAVLGFECHGWIMNHALRQIDAAAVSMEAARAKVSPHLYILSHQMALIPTDGQYEVLCHEFKCRTERDSHVLVYINAATGNEEQILLLLEDEHGTLVR